MTEHRAEQQPRSESEPRRANSGTDIHRRRMIRNILAGTPLILAMSARSAYAANGSGVYASGGTGERKGGKGHGKGGR